MQVNCFIVRKGAKGLRTEKIQNKIALRCVQNAGARLCLARCLHALCKALQGCMAVHGGTRASTWRGRLDADIYLDDCFVPDSARLPGVNSFKVAPITQHFPLARRTVFMRFWGCLHEGCLPVQQLMSHLFLGLGRFAPATPKNRQARASPQPGKRLLDMQEYQPLAGPPAAQRWPATLTRRGRARQDTNKVLAISRIMVAWQPVGLAMGVYDMCARYVRERRQFGSPLGAFQLVQERLARMQGDVQAMFLMAWRLSVLHEQARPAAARRRAAVPPAPRARRGAPRGPGPCEHRGACDGTHGLS